MASPDDEGIFKMFAITLLCIIPIGIIVGLYMDTSFKKDSLIGLLVLLGLIDIGIIIGVVIKNSVTEATLINLLLIIILILLGIISGFCIELLRAKMLLIGIPIFIFAGFVIGFQKERGRFLMTYGFLSFLVILGIFTGSFIGSFIGKDLQNGILLLTIAFSFGTLLEVFSLQGLLKLCYLAFVTIIGILIGSSIITTFKKEGIIRFLCILIGCYSGSYLTKLGMKNKDAWICIFYMLAPFCFAITTGLFLEPVSILLIEIIVRLTHGLFDLI